MRPHRKQIPVKTPATKQLNHIFTLRNLYEEYNSSLRISWAILFFSDCIQTGFATKPPWNVMYKTRHALLGNSAPTYARTPLKWGSQNYTLCPC